MYTLGQFESDLAQLLGRPIDLGRTDLDLSLRDGLQLDELEVGVLAAWLPSCTSIAHELDAVSILSAFEANLREA